MMAALGTDAARAELLTELEREVGVMIRRIRRLIAERALKMMDNRRVLIPPMTEDAFEQIIFSRRTLEPELASRAMDRIGPAEIKGIKAHDKAVDRAMAIGDVEGYMQANYRFHFAIYERARADTLLALVESIWLRNIWDNGKAQLICVFSVVLCLDLVGLFL